ncbi:charged multivesicular body protein 3-like [Gigantopelta aegis]|uniref:charged multivesicular body protein 3-like n=1 Tax=Gigantopelta aegis TaxID=1735272 RepID=UPI001B88CA0D|nr:charged multivesicular body protein 3-like [Gigantopelta aegis]
MGLFGKGQEKSPKDMVTEWTHGIRKEGYKLDRQIKSIQREQEKSKRMLKDSAKKGERESCVILAKEIVKSNKVVNKLYVSKAQLSSIQMQMKNQLATLRMAGSLEKSADVMKSMQQLVKVPELQATMREMQKEMMRAGIIEEMLDDTMESVMDDAELDDEAEEEVEKMLFDLTAGALGNAPAAVKDSLPTGELEGATASTSAPAEESDEEMESMKARLESLRS